jgi:hypothetical protein
MQKRTQQQRPSSRSKRDQHEERIDGTPDEIKPVVQAFRSPYYW